MIANEVKTIEGKVKELLEKYPALQDNTQLTYLAYLNINHSLRKRIGERAYNELKHILIEESVPSLESISRAKRKIQLKNEELRGKTYFKRKKLEESNRIAFAMER